MAHIRRKRPWLTTWKGDGVFYDAAAMRARSDAEFDAGLRSYMLRVYNHMAGGLALTGLVAYAAAASGFYEQIAGTPLVWLVILAPFAFLLALTFGIDRMGAATASFLFWCYAAVMGLSIAGASRSWFAPLRLRA